MAMESCYEAATKSVESVSVYRRLPLLVGFKLQRVCVYAKLKYTYQQRTGHGLKHNNALSWGKKNLQKNTISHRPTSVLRTDPFVFEPTPLFFQCDLGANQLLPLLLPSVCLIHVDIFVYLCFCVVVSYLYTEAENQVKGDDLFFFLTKQPTSIPP